MPSTASLIFLLIYLVTEGLSCQQNFIFRSLAGCEQDYMPPLVSPTLKFTIVSNGLECAAQCHRTERCKAISICKTILAETICRLYEYGSNGTCDSLSEITDCRYMEMDDPCPSVLQQFDKSTGQCVCSPRWMTGPNCDRYYKDCSEAYADGLRHPSDHMVIQIKPDISSSPFEVGCYLDYEGWTAIEHRDVACPDIIELVSLGWTTFQNGFGSPPCGFFLGLEKTYQILQNGVFKLSVEVRGDDGLNGHAYYDNFRLSIGSSNYQIDWDSYAPNPGGPAEDGFDYGGPAWNLKGNRFGTHDNDYYDCAAAEATGWWYGENCPYVNLHKPMNTSPSGSPGAAVWPKGGYLKNLHMFHLQIKRTA